MKKNDYRTEFEEHRKEIRLDEDNEQTPQLSRVELHRKSRKPKKRSRHAIINVILGLFALVMVIIFIFVLSDWYKPNEGKSAQMEDSAIRFETSQKVSGENSGTPSKDTSDDQKKEKEQADKNSSNLKDEETTGKGKEEVQQPPKQDPKPDPKPDPEPDPKPDPKPDPEPEVDQPSATQTHTVAPGENLYRISLKYYKSGDGVNKIRQANGLSSNEIVVGQTLVIP